MPEGFERALESALADSTLQRGDVLVWECTHIAPTGRLGAFWRPGQPPDLQRDALLDSDQFDEVEAAASECRVAVVNEKGLLEAASGLARLAGRLREELRHVEQWRHARDAIYLREVCALASPRSADESPVEVDARRTTARYVKRNFSEVVDEIEQTADRRLIREVGEPLALAELPHLVRQMLDFLGARATPEERDEIAQLLATPYLRHLLSEWRSRLM